MIEDHIKDLQNLINSVKEFDDTYIIISNTQMNGHFKESGVLLFSMVYDNLIRVIKLCIKNDFEFDRNSTVNIEHEIEKLCNSTIIRNKKFPNKVSYSNCLIYDSINNKLSLNETKDSLILESDPKLKEFLVSFCVNINCILDEYKNILIIQSYCDDMADTIYNHISNYPIDEKKYHFVSDMIKSKINKKIKEHANE